MGLPKIPNSEEIAELIVEGMQPMMDKLTSIEKLLTELVGLQKQQMDGQGIPFGAKKRVG